MSEPLTDDELDRAAHFLAGAMDLRGKAGPECLAECHDLDAADWAESWGRKLLDEVMRLRREVSYLRSANNSRDLF